MCKTSTGSSISAVRALFDVKKVLLRGLDEAAAAEPPGGSFSYADFIFTLLQAQQMTPDQKVRAKNRRAYLLTSIRAILKLILNTFKNLPALLHVFFIVFNIIIIS